MCHKGVRWKEVRRGEGERIVQRLMIEGSSGVSRKKCGVLGRGVRVVCGRRLGLRMGIKGWC